MTIRAKLLGNSIITFIGFSIIVVLGYFTISGFRSNINELITRSTPLQVKMLQFQQTVEQLSSDLLQTGMLDNSEELKRLPGIMDERRRKLEGLAREIQDLKGVPLDVSVFATLSRQVTTTVKEKFASIETFKAEASNLNGSIIAAERSLEGIRDVISGLRATAARRSKSYAKDLDEALKGGEVTGVSKGASLAEKVQNYRNGVDSDMELSRRVLAAVEAVGAIHVDLRLLDTKARMVMLSRNQAELDQVIKEIGAVKVRITKNLKQAESEVLAVKSGGVVKDAIGQIGNGSARASAAIQKIVAAQQSVLASMAQVESTMLKVKQVTKEQARQSEAHVSATTAEQQSFVESMVATSKRRTAIMLGGAMLIAALVLTMNGMLVIGIRRPLQLMKETISEIAENRDLRKSVEIRNNDEIGQSISSFNNLMGSFREIIGAMAGTAKTLGTTSVDLSLSAGKICDQVSRQSDRVTQVAAAGAEMSQTVSDVAGHTSRVADSANDAGKTARAGAEVVNRTINEVQSIARAVEESRDTIVRLNERSQQIGDIVATIREITDQTSLLALNAAIEAARAGEQGMGFSVVANEVRNLARRAEAATLEISQKLSGITDDTEKAVQAMQQSLSRVSQGVRYSEEAGEALQSIVRSVDGLQEMTAQIATATGELSATSDQISEDIHAIDNVLRETKEATDTIAISAERLAGISQDLKNELDQFRYDEAPKSSTERREAAHSWENSEFSGFAGLPAAA